MPCTGHNHDHNQEDDIGLSLQTYINLDQVFTLNEHIPMSGKKTLKPYIDRFTLTPSVISPPDEDDVELLMHIPFTEAVSIRSITVSGRSSIAYSSQHIGIQCGNIATSAPCSVKVFVNRTDLDFDLARELSPDAKIDLLPPEHLSEVTLESGDNQKAGSLDYPLRPASKFKFCNSITLFFPDNFSQKASELNGESSKIIPTEITYVGFKGSGTGTKRVPVECIYETKGMKKDHTVPEGEFGAKESKFH